MDKYYCIIRVSSSNIILYLLNNESLINCNICFVSNASDSMYSLINSHDIFINFSVKHLLYISQEIYKAELSQILGQQYVQS